MDGDGGRRFTSGLAVITVVGFAWRLGFTLVTKRSDSNLVDEGDAFFYSAVARNLAQGNWYVNPFNGAPAVDHPPLTVLLLGPASWVWPDSVLAQRLTMTVIGTLVLVAMGFLGRYVADWRVGLAAAGVAAVNPNLWMNDALIMSEAPSALLIIATMAAGFALARRPSSGRAVLAGAVCGLTVLARAEIGLFLPLMIVPLIVGARTLRWRDRIARLALATIAMGLVITPWFVWNQTRFERTVFISTNDGTTLLGANCPDVYFGGIVGSWSLQCVLDTPVDGLDASEASARQRHLGIDYLTTHKRRLPVVLVAREGRTFGFWRPDQMVYSNMGEGRPEWASWAGFWVFWALIPVSVAGAWRMHRRSITLIPVAAALATVVLVSALFYGIARFRLPLDLAMCLLAGVALARVSERRPGRVGAGTEPAEAEPPTR